jgi:hypothetical protein
MADSSKAPKKAPKPSGKGPMGPSIWLQLGIAFVIFVVLSAGYSLIRDYINQQKEEVAISEIAERYSRQAKLPTSRWQGDNVTATYSDKSEKTSHKEAEASLVADA